MRPLRTLILFTAILTLLPIPAGAADSGAIRGRVVNGADEKPQPGVRVVLSIGVQGQSEVETVEQRTDARGRYSFGDLQTGEDRIYAIDAFYDGGMFAGGALTLPSDTDSEPTITSSLRVWDTMTDPEALLITHNSIFLSTNEEGGVGAIESVTVFNSADQAYIGRGADDAETEPGGSATVGFALPAEADNSRVSIVDAEIDVPALLPTEYGFAITTALPPGETRFTFSYPIEGITGSYDISRRALYPIAEVDVYASPPLEVESNRLAAAGEEEVGGRTYNRSSATDISAGDSIQVIAVAEAGVPAALLAGMAGVLLLVLLLGIIPFIRLRNRRAAEPMTREELVRAIAKLDIEHGSDAISTHDWAARRAELKAELSALEDDEMQTG